MSAIFDLTTGEEIKAQHGEEDSVAVVEEGEPALRPATSLLSLPNDLLLPIFEEVYGSKREESKSSKLPQIADILVNKRIYEVARPVWFSRLSINESQLDERLSGLLEDDVRRGALRNLDVTFTTTFARLTLFALARIPRLTTLAITRIGEGNEVLDASILRGIDSVQTLQHLTITYTTSSTHFFAFDHCLDRIPRLTSCHFMHNGSHCISISQRGGLFSDRLTDVSEEYYDDIEWGKRDSIECLGGPNAGPCLGALLGSLEIALENAGGSLPSSLPLRRLVFDLYIPEGRIGLGTEYFTAENSVKLFRLLAWTRIRTLEFTSVVKIPVFKHEKQIPSMLQFKLSGDFTLTAKDQFKALSSQVAAYPALLQLHLQGSNVFDTDSSADEISKLSQRESYIRYPQLGALLLYLRETRVCIVTYRNKDEKREMRWTRLNERDEFRADCWTL